MPRRGNIAKRDVLQDPLYNSKLVTRLINNIMYDGKKCSIYSKWGIHKFEGELENDIMEIIPMFGINKYLTISENEIQEVYLVK